MAVMLLGGRLPTTTPDLVSGCTAWYKADAGTVLKGAADPAVDGDTVYAWNASYGSWNLDSIGGAPKYKTNIKNGMPAVLFSDVGGTDHVFHGTDRAFGGATWTVFYVWIATDNANHSPGVFIWGGGAVWNNYLQAKTAGTDSQITRYIGGATSYDGPAMTFNNWYISWIVHDGVNIKIGHNDTRDASISGGGAVGTIDGAASCQYWLGSSPVLALNGYVAETGSFNTLVSEANRKLIERYLSYKYDILLPY